MGRGLHVVLMLLAGRVDKAAALLDEPAIHRVHRPETEVLVPYLLASGCAGPRHSGWDSTLLAGLLAAVDHSGIRHPGTGQGSFGRDRSRDEVAPSLAGLFLERIVAEDVGESTRSGRLDAAVHDAGRQADAIVSGKVRGHNARAAHPLACCHASWSEEDEGFGATVAELPSLSVVEDDFDDAFQGIRQLAKRLSRI